MVTPTLRFDRGTASASEEAAASKGAGLGGESLMSLLKVEQKPGQEIVQNQDEDDGIDHGLGDGPADAAGAADGDEALMAADRADDDGEDGAFEEAVKDIAEFDHETQIDEERLEGDGDFFVEHG